MWSLPSVVLHRPREILAVLRGLPSTRFLSLLESHSNIKAFSRKSFFTPPLGPPSGIVPFPACPSAPSIIQRHSLLAFSPRVMRFLKSHLISHPWQCFHRPGTQEKFHKCCRTLIMDCRPFGCSQSQQGHLHLRGTLDHLCYFAVPLRK